LWEHSSTALFSVVAAITTGARVMRTRRWTKRLVLVAAVVGAAIALHILGVGPALADVVWTVPQP
jgi:hypothetical protein